MEKVKQLKQKKKNKKVSSPKYILILYVVGKTPHCQLALKNLKKICEAKIPKKYRIDVIDLLLFPQLAKQDEIIVIPTLIKKLPKPVYKVIGDLSNTEEVLLGLNLRIKP